MDHNAFVAAQGPSLGPPDNEEEFPEEIQQFFVGGRVTPRELGERIMKSGKLEERVQVLEKEIGRISSLSYEAHVQDKTIKVMLDTLDVLRVRVGDAIGMIEELSEKVASFSRTLDMLQEVLGVEVVVEEVDITITLEAHEL